MNQVKAIFSFIGILLISIIGNAQVSPLWGGLEKGVHNVGYRVINATDYSRGSSKVYNYKGEKVNDNSFRPMQINLWYPASDRKKTQKMKVRDYLYVEGQIKNSEPLTEKRKVEIEKNVFAWNKELKDETEKQKIFQTNTEAFKDAKQKKGKFPLIIYFCTSPASNYVLPEYLASQGFIVMSIPYSDYMGDLFTYREGWDASIRDAQFAINYIKDKTNADIANVGLIGSSHGGNISPVMQIQSPNVKGVVSLDGMEIWKVYKDSFRRFPFRDLKKINVPYVVFQSNIAATRLDYSFYEKAKYAQKTYVKDVGFSHADYSALSIAMYDKVAPTFYKTEKDLDKSIKIVGEYVLNFFESRLKNKHQSQQTLDNFSDKYKVTIQNIDAKPIPPANDDIKAIIKKDGFDGFRSIYKELKAKDDAPIGKGNLLNLGREYERSGKNKLASDFFILIAKEYPKYSLPYYFLGSTLEKVGQADKAKVFYKKFMDAVDADEDTPESTKKALKRVVSGKLSE